MPDNLSENRDFRDDGNISDCARWTLGYIAGVFLFVSIVVLILVNH